MVLLFALAASLGFNIYLSAKIQTHSTNQYEQQR